jgi:TPR repeat protein
MQFERGQHWTKDPAAARQWYERAAFTGEVDAQLNLAYLYALGEGIPRDRLTAYAWYLVAKDAGSTLAEENLGALAPVLSREQIATAEQTAAGLREKLRKP